jgi:F0F1-type ATP synthase assembly protein I
MAAQAAVGFIKQGCNMLHEGRMELEGAKKTVEGVISDVKAIKGIFDWFIGLFVSKPAKTTDSKPLAQKKATATTKQQQSYEELELKLISEIGANLGVLFDTQQEITNYYLELEETSKTNYDPAQNTSKKAIERALIELQMEKLMEQTREAMVYAPPELKDLYSRFLVMHGKIEREQEWARSEMIRRARLARWKKEQDEIELIQLTSGVIAVMFISLIFGWLMWQLRSWSTGY